MKWQMYFGALVISAGMTSQGFSFELLDVMLGGGGGCGSSCGRQTSCCKPKCSKPVCCKPAHDPCNSCSRDLFAGLRGLFDRGCCAPEPTCAPKPTCCAPKPTCCAPKPTCCAPKPTCCKPKCNSCCRGGLLDALFSRHSCNSCNSCNSCDSCGVEYSDGAAAAAGDEAPVPPAPMADPSASARRLQTLRPVSFVR